MEREEDDMDYEKTASGVCSAADYYRNKYIITEEQIDRAWEVVLVPANAYATRQALSYLNVIPCSECGGSGVYCADDFYPGDRWNGSTCSPCETCHRNGKSHGWVFKP
jgi:hypothetical protein